MNQEDKKNLEILDEEEKGNFFLLWKENNRNENISDLFDEIEKLYFSQEKETDSSMKCI